MPSVSNGTLRHHALLIAAVAATSVACDRNASHSADHPAERSAPDRREVVEPPDPVATRAILQTTKGDITCELFPGRAPLTVENFAALAEGTKQHRDPQTQETVQRPFYDGLSFHRVVPGFAVQAGDPTGTGEGGPGFTIPDELHPELRHDAPGVLSMANHGPDTGGSQFFITLAAAPHLDGRHAVFGRCDGPFDQIEEGDTIVRVEVVRTLVTESDDGV